MFELLGENFNARRGRLHLAHGNVDTPVFMPVGTLGSVKAVTHQELLNLDTQIILGNTYHLFLRPGLEVINDYGGLHQFINWSRPILTDSGGFQIFSLSKLNEIKEDGVYFQSHIDGQRFCLSPELVVEIQEQLGADIHMVLDECTANGVEKSYALSSMERSLRWAKRCRDHKKRPDLSQFGIVQGSIYSDLRSQCCYQLMEFNYEGYAIGGLSVGETKDQLQEMTAVCCGILPNDKPRYLMGVGTPLDIVEAVAIGIDMFDCVMPTRNGRNGTLFTSQGRINIKTQKYKFSKEPLDPECSCYTCKSFTKGYLRHLFNVGELTSLQLLSLHNVTYYARLMRDIRLAIEHDRFEELLKHHRNLWLNQRD